MKKVQKRPLRAVWPSRMKVQNVCISDLRKYKIYAPNRKNAEMEQQGTYG